MNINNSATTSAGEEIENKPRPFALNVNATEFVPRYSRVTYLLTFIFLFSL